MAKLKVLLGGTSTGETGSYAITVDGPGYYDGQMIMFKANHDSAASNNTLSVSGKAAKALKFYENQDIVAGDIKAGQHLVVVFDAAADAFMVVTPIADNT